MNHYETIIIRNKLTLPPNYRSQKKIILLTESIPTTLLTIPQFEQLKKSREISSGLIRYIASDYRKIREHRRFTSSAEELRVKRGRIHLSFNLLKKLALSNNEIICFEQKADSWTLNKLDSYIPG